MHRFSFNKKEELRHLNSGIMAAHQQFITNHRSRTFQFSFSWIKRQSFKFMIRSIWVGNWKQSKMNIMKIKRAGNWWIRNRLALSSHLFIHTFIHDIVSITNNSSYIIFISYGYCFVVLPWTTAAQAISLLPLLSNFLIVGIIP